MNGEIIGEDEKDIGVKVIDNNGISHQVEMHKHNGEIYAHSQDGYPDKASERTDEGNERVAQARRFARYYVYLQEGYDVILPPSENPVRIDAVRHAVAEMDTDEFKSLFGDLYQQFAYDERGEGQPAIELPPQATDPPIYCQNVYLGVDPLETNLGHEIVEEHEMDLTESSAADVRLDDVSEQELANWTDLSGEFLGQASPAQLSEAVYIDTTSELYVIYPDPPDMAAADDHLTEPRREPDTVIELLPTDPKDIDYFQDFLEYYLRCQIRDVFVEMGVHPPEEYQVLGLGRFMAARGYDYIDFYPPYHKPNSEQLQNSTLF